MIGAATFPSPLEGEGGLRLRRKTDEGSVSANPFFNGSLGTIPLIRRSAAPSPSSGEGKVDNHA
jgi:hypothetical protein